MLARTAHINAKQVTWCCRIFSGQASSVLQLFGACSLHVVAPLGCPAKLHDCRWAFTLESWSGKFV